MIAQVRDLIQGLCTVKEAHRLGYLKGGASDVMAHSWFEAFDWDGLVNMTVTAPWRPTLATASDTSCFDEPPDADLNYLEARHVEEGAIAAEDIACWKALQSEYAGSMRLEEMGQLQLP